MSSPNTRLTGGERFEGRGVLCPGGHELSFNDGCARGLEAPPEAP